jgi:NAD(P)-dependent dehydrogenase (short-subunit alcohol dehydrogenase family)
MRALITGANRGIGAALRDAGRAAGHDIRATARVLPEDPTGWLALDQTQPADVRALATALKDEPLDLLVLNAGVFLDRGQSVADGFAPDLWAETFAVNVTGTFLVAQALLPNLRAAGGKIAIISSQMGSSARAGGGAYIYRASKAAEVSLGRNLAVDLRADGVAVGIYHPGWVRTDMGGSAADIDAGTAAKGLWARFDALSLETSGAFEFYDGAEIPF